MYSQGAYRSGDLDFVLEELFAEPLEGCLAELGFSRQDRYFVHPNCEHLFIEFVAGPLGIGDDANIVPDTQIVNGQTLRILSLRTAFATDSLATSTSRRATASIKRL